MMEGRTISHYRVVEKLGVGGMGTPIHELRPDVPHELRRIVARALEKNREARYASAVELSQDLRACRAALMRPDVRRVSWSNVLRNRRVVVALALAGLGAVVGLTLLLRARAENRRVAWATEQLGKIERLADAGAQG